MAKGLTSTQSRVLAFIIAQTEKTGSAPTLVEMREEFGFRSNRGVTVHLDALVRKGCISRNRAPRGIGVIRNPEGKAVEIRFVPAGGENS